jgi:hypothetical protein
MVNASNKVLSRFNLADLTPKRSACSATITLKIKQYNMYYIVFYIFRTRSQRNSAFCKNFAQHFDYSKRLSKAKIQLNFVERS